MILTVLDIDGTCANSGWRFSRAGTEPKLRGKAYSKWLREVQSESMLRRDLPVPGMVKLAHALPNMVYLTGRSEIYREVTTEWLNLHNFPAPVFLYMRPKGSRERTEEFKERQIIALMNLFEATEVVVIDDDHTQDLEVVCKRNGWTLLKARSGS